MRKSKRPKGPNGRTAERVERRYSLSAETVRRLDVQKAMTGESPARAIDRLVEAHVRRFVVSDRGGEGADRPSAPRAYQPGEEDAA